MARSCPRCDVPLDLKVNRQVEVDLCPQCAGLFLDPGEFDELTRPIMGASIEEEFQTFALPAKDCRYCGTPATEEICSLCFEEVQFRCPDDFQLMRVIELGDILLDYCPSCHGVWLEKSEREKIRDWDARREKVLATIQSKPRLDASRREVTCSHCETLVLMQHCVVRDEEYYCEQCVVAGAITLETSSAMAVARASIHTRRRLEEKRFEAATRPAHQHPTWWSRRRIQNEVIAEGVLSLLARLFD